MSETRRVNHSSPPAAGAIDRPPTIAELRRTGATTLQGLADGLNALDTDRTRTREVGPDPEGDGVSLFLAGPDRQADLKRFLGLFRRRMTPETILAHGIGRAHQSRRGPFGVEHRPKNYICQAVCSCEGI